MNADTIFRKAKTTDLQALRKLMITTFRDTYEVHNEPENFRQYLQDTFSEERISEELQQLTSDYWIGLREEHLVCYFKLNYDETSTRFENQRVTEIQRIYVHPEMQGNGIGGLMLDKAKVESKRFGAALIWLGVWERNPAAIRFYERNGFEVFGTHTFRLGNDNQRDFMMRFNTDSRRPYNHQ